VRTYVLDTSALLALLQDKPGAAKVQDCLKEAMRGRASVSMSAVNYGEAFAVLQRTHGRDRAHSVLAALYPLPIMIEDATRQRAMSAADVRVRYKLYYADGFAAALAVEKKATLATSDSDFRRLGHGFPILWVKN
jgi:uncharacterized protein with PIN domain